MRKDLGFKRIATEEAFATKDLVRAYLDLLERIPLSCRPARTLLQNGHNANW